MFGNSASAFADSQIQGNLFKVNAHHLLTSVRHSAISEIYNVHLWRVSGQRSPENLLPDFEALFSQQEGYDENT